MDERHRAAYLSVAERAEPARPRGGVSLDPGSDRLDDEDVGQARHDRFAARSQLLGFGRHQPQDALHPVDLGRLGRVYVDRRRQDVDEVARRRMVEADGAADEGRPGAAAAVAKELVAVAHLLERQVEDRRSRRSRFAVEPVAFAMGNERELAGVEPLGVALLGLEPEAPRGDDVEPDVGRHQGERQAPGSGQIGTAVEGAVHAQEVERLAERIGRRPRIERIHRGAVSRVEEPIVQQDGRSGMKWRRLGHRQSPCSLPDWTSNPRKERR